LLFSEEFWEKEKLIFDIDGTENGSREWFPQRICRTGMLEGAIVTTEEVTYGYSSLSAVSTLSSSR
jgi:hypothetical protein